MKLNRDVVMVSLSCAIDNSNLKVHFRLFVFLNKSPLKNSK